MKNKPYDLVVSIVIYKPSLAVLEQTLDSLSRSSLRIKTLIFDNSPETYPEIKITSRHRIVYFKNKRNLGYGKAHNANLKRYANEAPFFLVLNPDIFFENGLLEELLRRMNNDPRIGLCIPRICHPTGELQLVNRRLPRPIDYAISFISNKMGAEYLKTRSYKQYLLTEIDWKRPFICPTISGCFMLFRTEIIVSVGGFDERFFLYLEDTDLSRRISENHKSVVFSDLEAYHHWSRGAYKNTKLFFLCLFSAVKYFNKWGWIWDAQRDALNAKVAYYQKPQIMEPTTIPQTTPIRYSESLTISAQK